MTLEIIKDIDDIHTMNNHEPPIVRYERLREQTIIEFSWNKEINGIFNLIIYFRGSWKIYPMCDAEVGAEYLRVKRCVGAEYLLFYIHLYGNSRN